MQSKTFQPKFLTYVVYKNSENIWRVFCCPYDVSCEASSKKEVFERLKKLTDFYEGAYGI